MRKILIIDTVAYDKAPYIKNYERVFSDNNVYYDIFSWDRDSDGSIEKVGNMYVVHQKCPFGGSKLKKIFPMYAFQKLLRKTIRNNNYDALVLIDSLAPVMISDVVLSEYQGKYILDIRDYTYEKYDFYLDRMMKLIDASVFTSISSKKFLRFLRPSNKYVVTHNISNVDSEVKDIYDITTKKTLSIGFVGNVRYYKENSLLIDSLKNSRYIVSYTGSVTSECNLKEYCKSNNINNVFFYGEFKNDCKPLIYKNIDIINSIYGDSSLEVTTALPNRLYDALLFKKPILASKGTYMGEIVQQYDIGLVVDIYRDNVLEKLNSYVANYSPQKVCSSMQNLLREVINEQEVWYEKVKEFTMM